MSDEKLETNCILLNRLEKLESYVISRHVTRSELDSILTRLNNIERNLCGCQYQDRQFCVNPKGL